MSTTNSRNCKSSWEAKERKHKVTKSDAKLEEFHERIIEIEGESGEPSANEDETAEIAEMKQ
jgi:hypothetical protein